MARAESARRGEEIPRPALEDLAPAYGHGSRVSSPREPRAIAPSSRRRAGQKSSSDADARLRLGVRRPPRGGWAAEPALAPSAGFLLPQGRESGRPANITCRHRAVCIENTHNRQRGTAARRGDRGCIGRPRGGRAGAPGRGPHLQCGGRAQAPGGRLHPPGGLADLLPVQGVGGAGGLAHLRPSRLHRAGPAGAQDDRRRNAAGGRARRGGDSVLETWWSGWRRIISTRPLAKA